MADVPGKFYRATKVRTGVAPSSAGSIEGEVLPPVNPPGSSLNSVGLTMPSAFTVSNSPLTANGTIGVAGAGTVAQYIRGDGSLADFPESSGGGSSVSYYLNGSVDQGTIGGIAYKELSKVPILGAGTDFTINADGYIASFITDAGDPNLLEIPGGNWNFETYFSASSSGGTPTFYVELYKVSGTTATLIASSSSAPELIAFGTNLNPYFSTLAVPTTTLALTDRLAVRYYVTHSGRTITLHTENNHLCQIVTTFTTGITALNGLTAQVQNFAVGTSGTDFNIASATATHTFNLPTASATNRGALSSADWSLFTQAYNDKINSAAVTGTTTKTLTLTQQDGGTITASWSDLNTDAVLSVFGRTGNVVAANGDYTTAQVTESGNLYYTDARSRAALSFAAGSGAYNTSTGVITIPTNNNQIANGAGYITAETDTLQSVILRNGTTNTGFNIFNSNDTYTSPASTNVPFIYLYNTGTTSTSNAVVAIRTNSATGGDPILSFDIGGVIGWSMGIDNSDEDKFKIARNWLALDSETRFSMSLDGTAVFTGNLSAANLSGTNTGNVTIGTANGLSLSGQQISLGLASSGVTGALSGTDWSTFNSKQNALTLTTSGTSGAATLVGSTLNIPNYTESDTLQSVILRNGTTNTGFVITNANNTYTTPAATNVPLIYMLNSGTTSTSHSILALRTNQATGGDPFISFDIQDVIGWTMGIDNSDDDKFKIANNWSALDSSTRLTINTSGNVGIGTTTPTFFSGNTTLSINNAAGGAVLELQSNGTSALRMATSSSDSALWEPRNVPVLFASQNQEAMRIFSSRNVHIGPTPASDNGARLQVSGAATVSSTLTADGVAFIGQVPTYGTDFAQFSHSSRAGANQYSFLSQNNGGTYVNSHNSQPIYFRHNNSNLATISSTGAATFSSSVTSNATTSVSFYSGTYVSNSLGDGSFATYSGRIRENLSYGLNIDLYDRNAATWRTPLSFNNTGGAATFSSSVTATNALFNSTSTQLILQNVDGGTNAERIGMFMTSGDIFKILSLNDNNTTRVDNIITANVLSGNVGIGTASPSTFLHVLGANTTDRGQLSIQSNNVSNAAKVTWYYHTTNQGEIGTTSGDFYALAVNNFLFYAGGSPRMTITSGGNVLIGTTTDNGSKLQAYGNANAGTGLVNIYSTQSSSGSIHPALQVVNDRGNHSYGTVAEFRIASTADTDRPSLLFSKGGTSNNWSLGMSVYAGSHDNFAIGYRSNYPISSWATSYLTITTGGNILINGATDLGIQRVVTAQRDRNDVAAIAMVNAAAGNDASAQFIISAYQSSGFYGAFSSLHNTTNWAGRSVFGCNAVSSGITVSAHNANQDIRFITNSTTNVRMVIANGGEVLIGTTTVGNSRFRLVGIPTSSSGLAAGDVWRDGGNLKIA